MRARILLLIQAYRNSINGPTYSLKDAFVIIITLLLLLTELYTVYLVRQQQEIRSSAAAPDQLEAEGGVLGGNAIAKADSNASGGQYIALGTNSTQTQTPAPTSGTYAATYTASSATDQTAALKSFIEANKGKRIALSGIIPVTLLGITLPAGPVTTIDFLPGSRIQGILTGVHGIFRFYTSWDVVLNDPNIVGTGYDWVGDQDPNQGEHGIHISGGGRITINRPIIRDTRGDGIYIGYQAGNNVPAVGVLINDPNIERSSRNGISPVAGEVTIRGGHIDRSGLDSIDFEPNDDLGATSISGIVSDIRLTRHGDLPGAAAHGPYAIAAGGYSTATKKLIDIQRVTGDNMRMTIRNTAIVIVQNNISDVDTTADFPGVGSLTFTNNTRITKVP